LAGPVVAAACILNKDVRILGVDDSKKLSKKKREVLYSEIIEKALEWSVCAVDNYVIDDINILNATKEAMRRCVLALKTKPDVLLIDAVDLKDTGIRVVPLIKGDAVSVSIAAASVIAKVTRDRIMVEYSEIYPGYGFEKHKGYGTKAHYDAIAKYGRTPIHRNTFLK
ncbi:ribonuclease HII, partial [Candidatus Nomurabacteria bacterium]|nr:ribonuclease HII [Candidatus Nomurabacteria bacterium]